MPLDQWLYFDALDCLPEDGDPWKETPRVLSLKEPTAGKKATESDPGGTNLRLQVYHQPTSLKPAQGGREAVKRDTESTEIRSQVPVLLPRTDGRR